ncbi:MAG: PAS domain-containing sensor histidine kinase [Candidatus Thorarchaeota archaeon]|nr:MAG: PAS domain-containing sensor histidine kinase [Candidatus Thorarchaeota archaeon]
MSKRAPRKSATRAPAFQTLSEKLPLAVLESKMDYCITYMNHYALNLLGLPDKNAMRAVSLDSLVVPEHWERFQEAAAALSKPGEHQVVSVGLQSESGERIDADLRMLLHGKGKSQRLRIFATEVSLAGSVSPRLSFSDAIVRTIIENSHDAIAIVGDDYKIEYVNSKIPLLVGGTKEDFIGLDFRKFIEGDVAEFAADVYTKRRNGESVPDAYPLEFKTLDGTPIVVEARASVVKGADGSRKTVVHVLDITDRRRDQRALIETEQRYRVLVETMNDGLAIDDPQGILVYANDAFCEMLDRSEDEMIGQPWFQFTKDKDQDWVQDKVEERRSGKTARYELEWIKKSGEIVPSIISATPLEDQKGNFFGTFAVITEISAQKEAEDTIQFYLDLLTHDIANQLQVMITATGLLDRELPDSYLEEAQTDILEAIERCNRLITKVKRAGEFRRLPTTRVDLTNVLEEKVKVLVRVYGATVFVEDIEPPVHVKADALLGELLWNLLENAVRHNPREKPRVWVSGSREDAMYKLAISDDGPGISSARKKTIFSRRGHSGGVGLTLVAQMSRKYGGTIEVMDRVKGKPSHGSKFILALQEVDE